jgi:2-polyprenyl-6-hydroxyphenyl methylase / 3-demethylubiquinone-9 3-methyltransferase
MQQPSVDPAEVAQFSRLGAQWWNERGPMRMLHRLNPVRVAYIREQATAAFGRDAKRLDALAGLRILDIGCGGGILCEPLARMGAEVVGVDPSQENIDIARAHAQAEGLSIDYRCVTAEELAAAGERFDLVLAMEVVEHVADRDGFVRCCGTMVKPGGLMIASTINRTLKSYALAIVAAEYILAWLPRGTHQWDKLVTPDELEHAMTAAGLSVLGGAGVVYDLPTGEWRRSRDMDVNYMLTAARPA